MTEPVVSIQIVVHNGERYICHCLSAVRAQTYRHIAVVILDNVSTDGTADIVRDEFPEFRLVVHNTNLGMWPGQELLLGCTSGEYVLALSADVILHPTFIERAVAACERDPDIAAVQGKMYQYAIGELELHKDAVDALRKEIIDTCGFALTRGRRVVNVGHGMPDTSVFRVPRQILGVEGAAPFFRRSALENCRVDGVLVDPDYFWYGDDLDLAWRMTLFGHRQMFLPNVIAWHDRSTTKGTATAQIVGQLRRLTARRAIPIRKRRLDWSNVRFTIIKNDYILNICRDLPFIALRELAVLGYMILFEPSVLFEIGRFLKLLPCMLRRRRKIMRRAVIGAELIRGYFL